MRKLNTTLPYETNTGAKAFLMNRPYVFESDVTTKSMLYLLETIGTRIEQCRPLTWASRSSVNPTLTEGLVIWANCKTRIIKDENVTFVEANGELLAAIIDNANTKPFLDIMDFKASEVYNRLMDLTDEKYGEGVIESIDTIVFTQEYTFVLMSGSIEQILV